jgi:tetratricopeptide (TPR) repeat protein
MLEISEREGMRFWISLAEINLGRTLADLGRAAEGLKHARRSVALQAEMGTQLNLSGMLSQYAIVLLLAGQHREAREQAERAVQIARDTSSRGGEAISLMTLGQVLFESEADEPDASEPYLQGLAVSQALGMRPTEAHCYFGLGQVAGRAGDRAKARAQLSAASDLYRDMGMAYYLERAEAELRAIQ